MRTLYSVRNWIKHNLYLQRDTPGVPACFLLLGTLRWVDPSNRGRLQVFHVSAKFYVWSFWFSPQSELGDIHLKPLKLLRRLSSDIEKHSEDFILLRCFRPRRYLPTHWIIRAIRRVAYRADHVRRLYYNKHQSDLHL